MQMAPHDERDIFDHLQPDVRFVMCPPNYLSTDIPNNVFMKPEDGHKFHGGTIKIDKKRAMTQYQRIKRLFESLDVEVLEIPPTPGAQDATYCANIAISIEPYIVLAKYKAEGRPIEEKPAQQFYESLGYQVIQPPYFFEGEADLKLWKDNVYFGGWGKFTDIKAHQWIQQQTGAQIIPIHEISDELYHLDCSLFVIDEENFLVNTEGIDSSSLRTLKQLGNVIEVPPKLSSTGITNAVNIPNKPIIVSGLFHPEDKKYQEAMEWIMTTFDKFDWSVILVDIDEPDKSGADVSCMVQRLTFEPDGNQHPSFQR